ncbi:MAG: hemolysin family protein, partial [Treponema sp.]|nr:hemolysin family protein [Treponema sp.]
MTEAQLRSALMEGEKSGIVESEERTMVEGVFYLGDRPVGAFMTHRSEIQGFDVNDDYGEVYTKALQFRDQRCFPVSDGIVDDIIGAAYLEDIIIDRMAGPNKGLRSIMKKACFVPQTMPALKAFKSFRKAQANYIFVMDEYGGFAGMLSVRDLLEEIVGELAGNQDESDSIVASEDGTWLADGGSNIDDIAEKFSLDGLAEEHPEYHTLAGFILSLSGELPKPGDSFVYNGFRFTIR